MRLTSFAAVCAAAIALASVAACSNPDSDAAGASGPHNGADIEAAKAFLATVDKPITDIGYDKPISKPAPRSVKLVTLENVVPLTKRVNDERVTAGKVLDWDVSRVYVGTGPEDAAKAMDQALDQNPDIIVEPGFGVAQISQQLARAEAEGVKVIAECITDEPEGALIAVDCDLSTTELMGKESAAYVVAHGNGDDHVQLFGTSTFPILGAYDKAFTKWMKQWCPKCTVTTNEFQLADIGSKLPGQVVSAFQRAPDSNWLIFGYGDAMLGVEPALEAAGFLDKIQIGGEIPGTQQYAALKAGKNAFWTQDVAPWIAWRQQDIAVRALLGESLEPITSTEPPNRLLTADNINDEPFDGDVWVGYTGYTEDYKKQWLIN